MRAASASRNNSEARVVTPAVARIFSRLTSFGPVSEMAAMRKPIAFAAASRASFNCSTIAGNVVARDRAVAERGGEKKQRGGEAEPRRRQPRDRGPRRARSGGRGSRRGWRTPRYGPHARGEPDRGRAYGAARQCACRPLPLKAPTASAVGRGVLHHPSHQLIEGDARVKSELGHERGLGHARLCIDLKTDQLSRSPIVVAEVCAAHAATAERVMGSQTESADLLVNIW